MVFMGLMALAAPLITPFPPKELHPIDRLVAPNSTYWFGSDQVGRDIYTRTIYGARVSLQVGFAVALAAMVGGAFFGLLAGYYRRLDMVVMRVMDGLMAIPTLLLAIAFMTVLGASTKNVIISLLIVMTPQAARVVRSIVLSIREEVYVEAARAMGVPDWRILLLHVFPGTIAGLIIQGTYTCAVAIIIEASLSFLGAGTTPDIPSWGNIMSEGRQFIRDSPWVILAPGLTLLVTVLGINLAGDGLRDILDPKLARRAG